MLYKSNYFNEDSYHTPENTRHALGDYLLLKSRWYAYFSTLRLLVKARKKAVNGIYDREAWSETSYHIFKVFESVGARFHINGIDNLRQNDKPVVIIANHMSTLETFVFPSIIASIREATFVIKDSILKVPLFKDVMKARDPIVVGRKNPRSDLTTVLKEGMENLTNKNTSVIIFPQSTRTVNFVPENFNSLGVKLAKKAGVKIVPCALKTDFWGNGKHLKELGPLHRKSSIHIEFGKPMEVVGNGSLNHEKIVSFIEKKLDQWNK